MHDRRSDDLFAFAFFRDFFIAPGLALKAFINESLPNLFLAEVIGFLGLVTGADGVAVEKVSSTSLFVIRLHTLTLRFGGSHCGGKESICFRKENVTAS